MDIGSGRGYPASALSNFAPHPFVFRGVQCNSMEGLLQSLKFKNPNMQRYVCSLVGREAKFIGKKKKWRSMQILWWEGKPIGRESDEYQALLDEAYAALAQNTSFRAAIVAAGDAVFEHSMGKSKPSETVLTRSEFCRRLTAIRNQIRSGA